MRLGPKTGCGYALKGTLQHFVKYGDLRGSRHPEERGTRVSKDDGPQTAPLILRGSLRSHLQRRRCAGMTEHRGQSEHRQAARPWPARKRGVERGDVGGAEF